MALIKCKECGKEVSEQAKTCPNCGAKILNNEETAPDGLKVICFLIPIVGIIVYATNISSKPKYATQCLIASVIAIAIAIFLPFWIFIFSTIK